MKKKLSSIQILRLFCLSILGLYIIIAMWGKSTLADVDMDKVMEITSYHIENDGGITPLYSKNHNTILKDIDKNVTSLQELIDTSEHVLVVTLDKYDISGNGLLASVTVEKVIKSDTLKTKDNIQIYDLVLYTNINYENSEGISNVSYVESNVPLKKQERYVVFIQKALNPVEKGSYMYASLRYGCFRITENPIFYTEYDSYDKCIKLKEALEYDALYFGKDVDEIEEKLYQEIFETYN